MDELLLPVNEVARRLSVGRSQVYELIASGALESLKLGRRRLVPIQALQAWVDRAVAANPVVVGPRDTETTR